jgi:hypothetical protein
MLLKNQSLNRTDIGEELGSRTNLQREVAEQGLQDADHGGTQHMSDNSSRTPAPGTENRTIDQRRDSCPQQRAIAGRDEDCLQTNQCSVLVNRERKQSRWDLYIWTATTARAGTELNGLIPLQSVGWKQCIRWAARPPKPVHNGRPGLRIVTRPSPLVSLYQAALKKKTFVPGFC